MVDSRKLTLYHWPQSRSVGIYQLLEVLKADYILELVDIRNGKHRASSYMAINPMGKVPAIKHGDAIVTEQVAIYIYLADLYADRNVAPALSDPLRGPYLRWMAFYAGCFEPAIIDKSLNREPASVGLMPYGDFDTMWQTLATQLKKGSFLLGENFTAADVLWGSALGWMSQFKLCPEDEAVLAYIKRIADRPAIAKANLENTRMMEDIEKAAVSV